MSVKTTPSSAAAAVMPHHFDRDCWLTNTLPIATTTANRKNRIATIHHPGMTFLSSNYLFAVADSMAVTRRVIGIPRQLTESHASKAPCGTPFCGSGQRTPGDVSPRGPRALSRGLGLAPRGGGVGRRLRAFQRCRYIAPAQEHFVEIALQGRAPGCEAGAARAGMRGPFSTEKKGVTSTPLLAQ